MERAWRAVRVVPDNGIVKLRRALVRPFRYPVRWLSFLAGGVPAILLFPAPSLSYLAWFALVPGMALFTRAVTTREAVARGWWFGAGYLIAMLYWMAAQIGPGLLLIGAVMGCAWSPFAVNSRKRSTMSAPRRSPAKTQRRNAPTRLNCRLRKKPGNAL